MLPESLLNYMHLMNISIVILKYACAVTEDLKKSVGGKTVIQYI